VDTAASWSAVQMAVSEAGGLSFIEDRIGQVTVIAVFES